jgi:hypothetical protein
MASTLVLAVHTLIFAAFIIGSASFPFFAAAHPEYMTWKLLLLFVALGVLVPYSWRLSGGCPFTVWENNLREKEKPGSGYKESCLERYARLWFGVRISRRAGTVFILAMLAVPLMTTALFVAFI